MAKRRGKSSPGAAAHRQPGRGGVGHQGPATSRHGRGGREDRREDRGYRNREDDRAERAVAVPADDAGKDSYLLSQLAKMPQGATAWQLAQEIGEESRDVGAALRRMVGRGQVLEVKPGRYQISGSGGEYAATLEAEAGAIRARLPDGSLKDVNPRYTIGAKGGDVVQVALGEDGLALVTRILRRCGREVVGTIQFKPGGAWLVCDNRREGLLRVTDTFAGFDDGYRVGNRYVGTIDTDSNGDPCVHLIRVLGTDTPEVADFQYVRLAHDLPGDFPNEVTAQAEAYPKRFVLGSGKQKREDLRKKLVFTIDPATAKDFDDAISLEHDDQGRWVLGVHIADVSHYVTEDTPLDAEAAARGTSVYLINRVIPMLPEVLSNGLCSLVPEQPRYCLSAFLTIDRHGKLVDTRLSETLIESRHRFTYEEAMDVLVRKDPPGKWPEDVRSVVREVGNIAQLLRRNREKAGALNLFSVEHRFRLDVNGVPIGVVDEKSDESHQLIEECMLLANKAVAEWLEKRDFPVVYRLHQEPDEERLSQFAGVLEIYGKDSSQIHNRFGLQRMLGELAKEPPAARRVLNYLCLRAFKKAVYGTERQGHYALAFAAYAHFTSPIRRYPDLLVHRLVKRALNLPKYKDVEIRPSYLDALAKQSSFLEQRAEQAERDLHARKAARYLAGRIGERFAAVVVSAFPGGLSIQMLETGMDGVLPMRELRDDFYTFDPKRLCLVGRRSARTIGCGSELEVIVNHVDIERADVVFGLETRGSFAQSIRQPKRLAPTAPAIPAPVEEEPAEVEPPRKQTTRTVAKPAAPAAKTTGGKQPPAVPKAPEAPAAKPAARAPAKPARRAVPAAATTDDDEIPGLRELPDGAGPVMEPATRSVTRRALPIDTTIDRRRVPDRWRGGWSLTNEAPQQQPKANKQNKKARRR